VGDAVLGIVANPLSGRDIRRLVAKASVFPTAEKANMVQRMLTASAAVGVERVLLSTDMGGISAAVLRALEARRRSFRGGRDSAWPDVDFVELPAHTQSAADTVAQVHRMIDSGAQVIVCLGGDGTARVAAASCGEVPLLPLSTGTNNAFPQLREATVAGLAAALVATGAVDAEAGTRRASTLLVTVGDRVENALVDVAVTRSADVGAKALWDPAALTELYVTFAEPDGIGLSSIPGLLCPSPRELPTGVALTLSPPAQARVVVRAPIAPGLVLPVGVASWRVLEPGEQITVITANGTVAVDGEREIEFGARTGPPVVRLSSDGPRIVDIPRVLAEAARRGLLQTTRLAPPRQPALTPSKGGTS
jgi:predicted polyphosphate/ATP-dependent NAD kinase